MTERELFEAIGHVDDDLILAADAPVKKRRRVVHLHWQQVVSVAACACYSFGRRSRVAERHAAQEQHSQ